MLVIQRIYLSLFGVVVNASLNQIFQDIMYIKNILVIICSKYKPGMYNIAMNVIKVIDELKRKYPNKKIIENKNEDGITTEIVCEINSKKTNSFAIAIIDSSTIHYHKKITETYKVIKGSLKIFKYNDKRKEYKEYTIENGKSIAIKPGEIHSNLGKETWVEVFSEPAWTIDDYINLETIIKKYLKKDS